MGWPLTVQLLQTGRPLPRIVHTEQVVLPRSDQPVIRFRAPVHVEDGRWLVLRVVDPTTEPDPRAPKEFGGAIAYAAPFFLDPDRTPAPVRPARPAPAAAAGDSGGSAGPLAAPARTLPTTGAGPTAAVGAAALAAAWATRRAGG